MKNKLIVKTILSCLLGAIIWCVLDYIIYLIKKESFVDISFSTKNLIELVICMIAAGIVYYSAQKKKNGTN